MPDKSFGPIIWQDDENDIQSFKIRCAVSNLNCCFLVNNTCTENRRLEIPDVKNTPEWCSYYAQAEADILQIKGE